MAAPDASASVLAWSWVIESLATSPDVALTNLHDLIGTIPNLSANLGKEAREMVALRCLEDLHYPVNGTTSLSSDQKEFEFDTCESSEQVLRRVVEQTSVANLGKGDSNRLANLRKAASDELARGVHTFVDRRKTSLPKCALEQLKERLHRGDVYPPANANEMIGPEAQNTSPENRNNLLEENSACATPVCLKRDRGSFETEMHDGNDGIAHAEHYSPPLAGVETFEDASQRNVPPVEGEVQELMHEGNDDIAHTEHYSPPIAGVEVSEDALRRNVPPTEGEVPEAAQEVRMELDGREPARSTRPRTCQQPDACMKCEEGGKLLTCVNNCQMVVHESCLGVPARLDSKGDFTCPLCAHSQALSNYAEATKEMLLASERLSLFVGTNPVPWQLNQLKVLSGVNVHPQREVEHVDKNVEATSAQTTSNDKEPVEPAIPREDAPSKQIGAYPVDRASKDKKQEDHLAAGSADSAPNCSAREGEGEDVTGKVDQHEKGQQKMQVEDFGDAGLHGSSPKQQLHGPSKNAGTREAGNLKHRPSRNCSRPRAEQKLADQMKDALSASLGDHDGTSEEEICKDNTSKYPPRRQSKQKHADPKNASSASHNYSNKTSGEEDCTATSKNSLRSRGKGISYYDAMPTTPLERRIRIHWTAEEVEMLKEGVKRFAPHGMKNIPWATILDFGSLVFLKGRTAVDLKDKWRNLVRSGQI